MEERKLNEKESLELITRMIRNTKHNLEIGDGNIFLFWGISDSYLNCNCLPVAAIDRESHVLFGIPANHSRRNPFKLLL